MSLLVETLYVKAGKIRNLSFHQSRYRRSCKKLFGKNPDTSLKKLLTPKLPQDDVLYKCRVLYNEKVKEITFIPYTYPEIKRLAIVRSDDVEYSFKWADRPSLDELFRQRGEADEIIIVRKGWVTDAYYYNIVFEKNGEYFTPKNPLLKGIQRAVLIRQKKIIPVMISVENIYDYEKIHLINAMTELGQMVVNIRQILKDG
jgi:4-amino-4-deoxychorismate lyase